MTNFPEILVEVERLRIWKRQNAWTNAQVATNMSLLGWTILEGLVEMWLNGKKKPTEDQEKYISLYLADSYTDEELV